MKPHPYSSCSPYLRKPLRTLDEALSDVQAGEAFVQDVWYKFAADGLPQSESNHAAGADTPDGRS